MRAFWKRYCRRTSSIVGLVLLVAIVAMALIAPFVYPDDPWNMAGEPFLRPGAQAAHPLGTDVLGRDIAAGIFHGARVSLMIGIFAALAALLAGVTVGAIAGYYGSWIDDAMMRLTEVFQTMPNFVFALVLVAIFQPTITTITLAISAASWPSLARIVRAEFLSLRSRDFVQSCRVIGMSDARIIASQILPNALPPIIVTVSILVATAILVEAGLAFVGLGDPNRMSWGTMIAIGRTELRNAWYMCAIPGIAIIFTVLSLNLVGEGLNDALNPRLRER